MKTSLRIRIQILLVFLMGCVVGGVVGRANRTPYGDLDPHRVSERLEGMYARKLKLSAQQRDRLRPEIHRMAQEIVAGQRQMAMEYLLLFSAQHLTWEDQLNPEQVVRLRKWESNMRSRIPDQRSL